MAKRNIRIVVVDDHPFFRIGLKDHLDRNPDMQVVGEACNGLDALSVVQELKPDIVLMDLSLPGMNGIESTRRIISAHPDVRILVLTGYSTEDAVLNAIRAGASGFMTKDAPVSEVVETIRKLANDRLFLPQEIIRKLIDGLHNEKQKSVNFNTLTARELEVLKAIASGCSNTEVAQSLNITEGTVRSHINHILRKLNVENRTQAALLAVREGIVTPPEKHS